MANSVKIFESASLDRTKEVMKWIEFGVALTSAVMTPIKKTRRFMEVHAEMVKDASTDLVDDVDISNAGSDMPEVVESSVSTKFKTITDIFGYINHALTINKAINFLLANEEVDRDIFGIHIKKKHLQLGKNVIIGSLILIGLIYWYIGGDNRKSLKEGLKTKWVKYGKWVMLAYHMLNTIAAVYLLYVLIKLMIKGKKWTVNDSANLISVLNTFLSILDWFFIEERLVKTVKPYWIGVGVSSLLGLAKAVIIPFTKVEGTAIDSASFSASEINSDENRLFVYFCGTQESTKVHLKRFMKTISAKHQIYINGVGSVRTRYEQLYDSDLVVNENKVGNNTMRYDFKDKKRDITSFEKYYTGGDRGYYNDDAEKASLYMFNALKERLNENKQIDEVILSGHSRGAAVGLMSLLQRISIDKDMVSVLSKIKVCIVPMDPVAGQTSNHYGILPENWYAGSLYDKLYQQLGKNLVITEIWATSAEMSFFTNFNPSKRFMTNPKENVKLARLLLGYEHSAMVSDYEDYIMYYPKDKTPYSEIVKFFNERLFLLNNAVNFGKRIADIQSDFAATDKWVRDEGKMNYGAGRRTKCKDHLGKVVDFFDWIPSYNYKVEPTP